MIKLSGFNNIKILIKFFCSNALKGMLSRPILAKKSTRIAIISLLAICYTSYFIYNIYLLSQLYTPKLEGNIAQKITFYSYFSNIMFLTLLVYLIVDNTVGLDKNSFFVKVLPFRNKDVNIAYILFKFIIMSSLYIVLSLIISVSVRLITSSILEYIFIVLSQYFVFLSVICLLELMSNYIISISSKFKNMRYLKDIYNCILLSLGIVYFFQWRFELEPFLANITKNTLVPTIIIISVTAIISILLLHIIINRELPNRIHNDNKFVYIKYLPKTIFRYKKNWYILLMLFIFLCVIALQSGFRQMLLALANILPAVGIILLPYADITANFRKQYHILRISIEEDCLYQITLVLMLMAPSIICYLYDIIELDKVFFSFYLSMIALILGFVFPKSYSSINEMSSIILLVILISLISMILNNLINGLILLIILITCHYFIVRRVRNEDIQ